MLSLLSLRRSLTWILFALAVCLVVVFFMIDRQHIGEKVELNLEIADAAIGITELQLARAGPIEVRGGQVYAGETLLNNSTEIVDAVERQSGFGCTIFHTNVRIATTARAANEDERAVGTRANEEITRLVYGEGQVFRGVTRTIGKDWVIVYVPLPDRDGQRIGMLATWRELDEFMGKAWRSRLVLGGTLALLYGLLVALVLLREQRAHLLERQARRLASANEELERRGEALQAAELAAELARVQAENASAAKSSFLASMSHELRTPLNAILGYSELVIEDLADGEASVADVRRIKGAGAHLLAMINDLLDLEKIEAGRMEVELEVFALAPVLESVLDTVRPLAETRGNRLVLEIGEEVTSIESDERRVRQILFNLLSNACKFTSEGVVRLSARGRADAITLSVSDTGVGLAADKLETVFEPFRQAERSTSRKHGGTGLGLTITRELSRLLGGGITVTSELGVGTTFTVTLPERSPR